LRTSDGGGEAGEAENGSRNDSGELHDDNFEDERLSMG
jgi:hypothetical protein